MLYAIKFRRKLRRGKQSPWSPLRVLELLVGLLVLAGIAWCLRASFFYVRYDMPHPHSGAVWGHQFGSLGNDVGEVVAADRDGSVYVAGETDGGLFGASSTNTDAFIAKYSAAGDFLWGRQYGCDGDEVVSGVAPDASGNVYLVGGTEGDLFGHNNGLRDSAVPHHDAFVIKLNKDGAKLWATQFGTDLDDVATAVAVDDRDNVYIAGDTDGGLYKINAGPDPTLGLPGGTSDVWVAKYTPDGVKVWALQFGGPGDDSAESMAVDGVGDVYVAGGTHQLFRPSDGDRDAFIAKIDRLGNPAWGSQMTVQQDGFQVGVACDSHGDAYLAADMLFGNAQALLAMPAVATFSPTGIETGRRSVTADLNNDVLSAVPDSSGGLILAGSVTGYNFSGDHGADKGFVSRYDSAGKLHWSKQFGGQTATLLDAAYVDSAGYVYAAGKTEGALYAPPNGSDDAVVIKLDPKGETQAPTGSKGAF